MHPIRTARAALTASSFVSLGQLLSRHRALTRLSIAITAFTVVLAFSQPGVTEAGPGRDAVAPQSLLPHNIGIGVPTDDPITVRFDAPMDRASVEAGVEIIPDQPVSLAWDDEGQGLEIAAERRWRTDQRYLVVVPSTVQRSDGTTLGDAARYSFTTQTAPTVTDFEVDFVGAEAPVELPSGPITEKMLGFEADASAPEPLPPSLTAPDVSSETSVSIGFSALMDTADVESNFVITPEAPGELTWNGTELTFTPSGRLEPGRRYTISLVGAHDSVGNLVGGKANFTFITREGAQLVSVSPGIGETDATADTIEAWFSEPMDAAVTAKSFVVNDLSAEATVEGTIDWNAARTQIRFTPDEPLAAGTAFEVSVGSGSLDQDGNALTETWSFTIHADVEASVQAATPQLAPPAPAPAPVAAPPVAAPAPSGDMAAYVLAQINSARAAYGFAPLVLDAAVTAAASAHAWDQAINGYFSHYSLDGRSREQRLAAAGVSFSYSGENQCYYAGMSVVATLDWCHGAFMTEPYPGQWNHIANILDPRFTRVGVGIGQSGGRIVITWDFVN